MSMINREEAIRLVASYPGPVDKSVVRRILTQMDDLQPTCNQLATDCISRQAALELFKDAHPLDYISQAYLEQIRALPSAQPERKKGRWLTSDDMYETGICSVCKCDSQEPVSYTITMFKYCPNCGADMR